MAFGSKSPLQTWLLTPPPAGEVVALGEQVYQWDGETVCWPSDPTPQRRIENQSVAHAAYCSGNVAVVASGAMAIRSGGRVVIVWISLHRTGPGMVFGVTAALCEGRNDHDQGRERAHGDHRCLRFHVVSPAF